MTYIETCRCGASMTIEAWGVRDVSEPVNAFRAFHRNCQPSPMPVVRPLPRDPGRKTRTGT